MDIFTVRNRIYTSYSNFKRFLTVFIFLVKRKGLAKIEFILNCFIVWNNFKTFQLQCPTNRIKIGPTKRPTQLSKGSEGEWGAGTSTPVCLIMIQSKMLPLCGGERDLQDRRQTSKTTLTSFTKLFTPLIQPSHLTFSPQVAPKTAAAPPSFRPDPTSSYPFHGFTT